MELTFGYIQFYCFLVKFSVIFSRTSDASLSFELDTGMLVAVPIPEEFSLDGAVIEHAIQTAVQEAECVQRYTY